MPRKPKGPSCNQPLHTVDHEYVVDPLWKSDGRVSHGSPEKYMEKFAKQAPMLCRGGTHACAGLAHAWALAHPGQPFWTNAENGFIQSAAKHAANDYNGEKTVEDLAAWFEAHEKLTRLRDKEGAARLLITGRAWLKKTRYLHLSVASASTSGDAGGDGDAGGGGDDGSDSDHSALGGDTDGGGDDAGGDGDEDAGGDDGSDSGGALGGADAGADENVSVSSDVGTSVTNQGGEHFAEVIAEASEDATLKRKADVVLSGFTELKQELANKKAKKEAEEAAAAEEAAVWDRLWRRPVSTRPVSVDTYDKNKCGLYLNTPRLVEGGAFIKLREDAFNGKLGQTVRGWEARAREHGNGEMGYENLHWVPDPDPYDDQEQEERFLKKAEEYALHLLTEQGYKRTGPTHEDFTFPTAEERETRTLEAMQKAMKRACEARAKEV